VGFSRPGGGGVAVTSEGGMWWCMVGEGNVFQCHAVWFGVGLSLTLKLSRSSRHTQSTQLLWSQYVSVGIGALRGQRDLGLMRCSAMWALGWCGWLQTSAIQGGWDRPGTHNRCVTLIAACETWYRGPAGGGGCAMGCSIFLHALANMWRGWVCCNAVSVACFCAAADRANQRGKDRQSTGPSAGWVRYQC
jgi:hypothetical protein